MTQARSLVPKEHGAYGQLGLPLAAALGMGRPGPAAALLAGAAVLAFVAHEPLLIALGHRGARARREDGARARRALLWLGGAALVLGAAGIALAPVPARVSVAVPLLLSALVGRFIARADERSMLGEIAAAAALAAVALPVALASGVPVRAAAEALVSFCLAFGAATWSVRSVIASHKVSSTVSGRALPLLLPAIAAIALHAGGALSGWAAGAIIPMQVLALGLAITPPHPRSLRKVGFGLVGASAAAAGLLIAGARL